jgi:hypothetical protein
MSWIADRKTQLPTGGEHLLRVYAHRVDEGWVAPAKLVAAAESGAARWCDASELHAKAAAGELACGGDEAVWLRMWQEEEDVDGGSVCRGYGFCARLKGRFKYLNNLNAGSPLDNYRVGVFDEDGLPLASEV